MDRTKVSWVTKLCPHSTLVHWLYRSLVSLETGKLLRVCAESPHNGQFIIFINLRSLLLISQ